MRTSHIRIDKNKIINNLTKLRKASDKSEIIGIVKANAYGHGIVQIARTLRQEGVEYLGVAFPVEAARLRKQQDYGKILIIVPPAMDDCRYLIDLDLEFVTDDFGRLNEFNDLAASKNYTLKAHLFVNTGMNRDGIPPEDCLDFCRKAKELSSVQIKGICTQLADSELQSSDLAKIQINKFNQTIRDLKKHGFNPEMKHLRNTGGVINFPKAIFTHSRVGIGLFGYADTKHLADKLALQPALSLVSELLTVRSIKKGENIGYSKQFIAKKDMLIGVVPIGYGDGYSKLFTNIGKVIHNGKYCSIIGSVCMDQFMIDLSDSNFPSPGDKITLIGEEDGIAISAYDLANQIGTIPYEILTSLNSRLTRKYQN